MWVDGDMATNNIPKEVAVTEIRCTQATPPKNCVDKSVAISQVINLVACEV